MAVNKIKHNKKNKYWIDPNERKDGKIMLYRALLEQTQQLNDVQRKGKGYK